MLQARASEEGALDGVAHNTAITAATAAVDSKEDTSPADANATTGGSAHGNGSNRMSHRSLTAGVGGGTHSFRRWLSKLGVGTDSEGKKEDKQEYCAGWWRQLWELYKRTLLMYKREPILTRVRLAQSVVVGVIVGLIFLQIGTAEVCIVLVCTLALNILYYCNL